MYACSGPNPLLLWNFKPPFDLYVPLSDKFIFLTNSKIWNAKLKKKPVKHFTSIEKQIYSNTTQQLENAAFKIICMRQLRQWLIIIKYNVGVLYCKPKTSLRNDRTGKTLRHQVAL